MLLNIATLRQDFVEVMEESSGTAL